MIPRCVKDSFYRALFGRWPPPPEPEPGYSLLFTVPPDLPVFLRLAVEVCRRQDPTGRIETLVVPDRLHLPFRAVFDEVARSWPDGKLRLVEHDRRCQVTLPWLKTPSEIHWLQLITGAGAARGTHAILHDADLFALEPGYLRSLFETCRDRDLACLGNAAPGAGMEWTEMPRFAHVVALWELTFELAWMRGQPPDAMRPRKGDFPEGTFWFETSLLAQARTPAARIDRHPPADVVHFGWVIGGYRTFQRSRGPFEDDRFRLLLIRLLIDAFDPTGSPYEIPTLDQLERGLRDDSARVFYGPNARANYPVFRGHLDRLFGRSLFDPACEARLQRGLTRFDRSLRSS